jgi:cysteinyl-tRNA synthetase
MELLRDRTVAKKQKNYQKADLIKQSIIDLGFGIKDNADGTTDLFVQ